MRLSFRAKLLLVVGATAVAFVLLILLGRLIDEEEERRLADLQGRLLPKLELRPLLEANLQGLTRSVQDAVAAQDMEELERTQQGLATFMRRLDEAGNTLDAGQVTALRIAVEDYYRTAHSLSRRMIGGETGESVTEAIANMQAKQAVAFAALERTVGLDRRELTANFSGVREARANGARVRLYIGLGCLAFALGVTVWLSGGAVSALRELNAGFGRFGRGDFGQPVKVTTGDEFAVVGAAANRMAESLRQLAADRDHAEWLTRGQARLADELRGELTPAEIGVRVTRFLAGYMEAPAAAFYLAGPGGELELLGQYALGDPARGGGGAATRFARGEGLLGQAALGQDLLVVDELPPNFLRVRSGLGEQEPRALVLLPVLSDGRVRGVAELAAFRKPTEGQREFLLSVRETLAIAVAVAEARVAMQTLLAETQRQAALLTSQEEELRSNNEELQAQQEELRQSNDELEQQQRILERQNRSLEEARARLQRQAEELITVSTYKSRFLANMSHELRTPLNSMLILSNLLAQNEAGNLTAKQVEYCRTVHSAGKDLLALINQVLDLAKIEAGKQDVHLGPIDLADLVDYARRLFLPLAADKGLTMEVDLDPKLPASIVSDQRRVEQILTNLVGNAIKFTAQGKVTLRLGPVIDGVAVRRKDLLPADAIAISVTDTGVGIARDDQERIFSPFEQAEARSDRRYGGTGLGLTIARELAALLGGELQLQSEPGQGSTFTLYLPRKPGALAQAAGSGGAGRAQPEAAAPAAAVVEEKSAVIERRGGVLVVEDDLEKGESLTSLLAAEGFDPTHVTTGGAGLIALEARRFGCLILDLGLPDMEGVEFLERMEKKVGLESPPVLIHTGRTLNRQELQRLQAYAHAVVVKEGRSTERLLEEVRLFVQQLDVDPGQREPARAEDPFLTGMKLIIADDDMRTAYALAALLRTRGAEVLMADTGEAVLELLGQNPGVQAVLTDLMMPEMDGYETLRRIRQQRRFAELPIVALSAKAMKGERERCLEAGATAYLPKPVDNDELLALLRRLVVAGQAGEVSDSP